MFWLQLLAILADIVMLLLKKFGGTVLTVSAQMKLSDLRKDAIKSHSLVKLKAYRDSLKA